MAKILVIDDEHTIGVLMSRVIERMGHTVAYTDTINAGLEAVRADSFDIVFLDVQLPDGNGLQQLPVFQQLPSAPEVIIITGFASSEGAKTALSNDAWDYIQKPVSVAAITSSVERALQYRKERSLSRPPRPFRKTGIIGNNPRINSCLDTAERAACSDSNVLIVGETGTGKELFARAVHDNSQRAAKNFIVVDCGALPESIVENLLLGHAKGAFTSAEKAEEGLIKRADGGTLFLDEVGELSPNTQKVFLRVLQERSFCPIGDTRETQSDFRLVAASNRNLAQMVKAGQFRADLLYRLGSISIEIPPLRDRIYDIKELALHHLGIACGSLNIEPKEISDEFFEVIQAYHWPGNVRELFGVLDAAIASALHENTIFARHLPKIARSRFDRDLPDSDLTPSTFETLSGLPSWQNFRRSHIEAGEKKYLRALISLCQGNVLKAAEYSGLSRPHLYGLLRKYEISG